MDFNCSVKRREYQTSDPFRHCLSRKENLRRIRKAFLSVFSGVKPFAKIEDIHIHEGEGKQLKNARDMVATGGLILIGELNDTVIWKMQLPGKQISQWNLNGTPHGMSVNPTGHVLVLIWKKAEEERARREELPIIPMHLNVYEPTEGAEQKSIKLDERIFSKAYHAVQTSRGTYIVAHSEALTEGGGNTDGFYVRGRDSRTVRVSIDAIPHFWITEINDNGDVLRSHKSFDEVDLNWPSHLAIESEDKVFISDQENDRILMLDSSVEGSKASRVVLTSLSVVKPARVCYVGEENKLIVGQVGNNNLISVFSRINLA